VSKRNSMKDYDAQIREQAAKGVNTRQIALSLGLERGSVRYYVKVNNIEIVNGKETVVSDKQLLASIVTQYESGAPAWKVAEQLGVNIKSVYKVLKANGTKLRDNYEMWEVNGRTISKTAFSDFDNDRLAAYFYGWLVTDGCIHESKHAVSIGLKASDGYMVEAFKNYVGSSCKTHLVEHKKLKKFVVQFSVSDKRIADCLRAQGMEARKSCKEKLPKFDWLYGKTAKDFWQGAIEGDGYIRCGRSNELNLLGSDELLDGFRQFCEKVVGVETKREIKATKHSPSLKSISYLSNDAAKIAKYLWTDTVQRLERKYEIAVALQERMKVLNSKVHSYVCRTQHGTYSAMPRVGGKIVSLGTFKTKELAEAHRDEFLDLYNELKAA